MIRPAAAFLATTLVALAGPPRVTIHQDALPPGVLARVETHVHVEKHEPARVSGQIVTLEGNRLVRAPLPLREVEARHWYQIVAQQAGTGARLLVVTVSQGGPDADFGPAEAVVAVDGAGRIREVTYPRGAWMGVANTPRQATERELRAALARLAPGG